MSEDGESFERDVGAAGSGVSADQAAISRPQSNRKIFHAKATGSGTTFVSNGVDSAHDNVWTIFPWEYPHLFVNEEFFWTKADEYNYFKVVKVSVTFHNATCIQTTSSSSGNITISENTHSKMYGYVDDCYNYAPSCRPSTLSLKVYPPVLNALFTWTTSSYAIVPSLYTSLSDIFSKH